VADATCAGCGCVCDDIEVTVADGRLAGLTRTCPLGDSWFAERGGDRPPVARLDGHTVSLDEAVEAAAAILNQARVPLVYGLGQTSCEAQRRAVALAEAIGAVVDPAGSGAAQAAYQAIGSSTATFGEIRDRAKLVVVWRADPVLTHPRLLHATPRSSTAPSTSSVRWRCSRSCATSAVTATRLRWDCAVTATRAAPKTCSPGRPASPPR
jgi:formylmethanofuran dehydrogenase subunit B